MGRMINMRNLAITYDEVDHRLDWHPPTSAATGDAHATVRALVKACTKAVLDVIPPGREASLFATDIQSALQWANAAIACNGGPREGRGLDELAEIRGDFNVEYGSRVNVPTDGPISEGRAFISATRPIRDAEDRTVPGLDTQV